MDAVQKVAIHVDPLAPRSENSPVRGRGPQEDRAQVNGQEKRQKKETQEYGSYVVDTQKRD